MLLTLMGPKRSVGNSSRGLAIEFNSLSVCGILCCFPFAQAMHFSATEKS